MIPRIAQVCLGAALSSVLLVPLLPAVTAAAAATGDGSPKLVTIHEESLPVGVSADDPTDTASLLKAAGIQKETLTQDGTPKSSLSRSASSYFPSGPSVVPGFESHVAPACEGTGTDGRRVRVLYARETGDTSRMTLMRAAFLNELAQVDDLFAYASNVPGEGRRVRWYSDANCQPTIDEVVLPAGALSEDHAALAARLRTAGYSDGLTKYLVFAEGNRLGGRTCGLGNYWQDPTPGATNYNNGAVGREATVARVDTICWFSSASSAIPTHELIHTLGGVMAGAPNATLNGHCDDASDPMCYDDGSGMPMRSVCTQTGAAINLDCNKDDYFNVAAPAGTYLANNWNTANSLFLAKVPAIDETDPWDAVSVTANPSPAVTGVDSTVTVNNTPAGTNVAWTMTDPNCVLDASGTSGTLNCNARALDEMAQTASIPVTVTLTHADLPTTSRTLNVTLNRGPTPLPVVSAPTEIRANKPTLITATAPGVGPLTWAWRIWDTNCSLEDKTTASVTVTCSDAAVGTKLYISVTAESADTQTATSALEVPVTSQYQPVATILGPTDVRTGIEYTYTGGVTDAGPGEVAYSWSDQGNAIVGASDGPTVVIKPTAAGGSDLTLTATVGNKTVSKTMTYTAKDPYTVTLSSNHETAVAGSRTRFTAQGSGTAASEYSWSFGQPTTAECTISAVSPAVRDVVCPASYSGSVTATVTGVSAGESATASHSVVLSAAPFNVSFTSVPSGTVASGAAGTFAVTSSLPATLEWEVTPASCVVGNKVVSGNTVTGAVTCPTDVSGPVDLEVTATEVGGDRERVISSTMTVAPDLAPTAPTSVRRVTRSATTMTLQWTKPFGATKYVIAYGTRSNGASATYRTVGDVSAVKVTGLRSSTLYYFRVMAYSAGGKKSPYSSFVALSTAYDSRPGRPGSFKVSSRYTTYLRITWRRPSYAVRYRLYYGTRSNGSGARYKNVTNVSDYRLTGLSRKKKYYVRLVPYSEGGRAGTATSRISAYTR